MKTLNLYKFELYQVSRELSRSAWKIYLKLPKKIQYNTGDQFLSAANSVQANVAEGHGRYHYKDKMKFEFNARGSLYEIIPVSKYSLLVLIFLYVLYLLHALTLSVAPSLFSPSPL